MLYALGNWGVIVMRPRTGQTVCTFAFLQSVLDAMSACAGAEKHETLCDIVS